MSLLEPRDLAEVVAVEDPSHFRDFQAKGSGGLLVVAEPYGDPPKMAVSESAGDFTKWLRANAPAVQVHVHKPADRVVLRSGDYWLPLVFLSSDVSVQIYLNLVANYIYDQLKGALQGDKSRVRLSATYEDSATGTVKRFDFEGDQEALTRTIKRFDLNRFLDE